MAIICPPQSPLPTDPTIPQSWYWQAVNGTTTIRKNPTHLTRQFPASPLTPTFYSGEMSWNAYNNMMWATAAHMWPTDPRIGIDTYRNYAAQNTITNKFDQVTTPNAFQLYMWHASLFWTFGAFYAASSNHKWGFTRNYVWIKDGWTEQSAPAIVSASMDGAGNFNMSWNPSWSTGTEWHFLFSFSTPGLAPTHRNMLTFWATRRTSAVLPPYTIALTPSLAGYPVTTLPTGTDILVGVRQIQVPDYLNPNDAHSKMATMQITIS